ncbi:lytic transglycosylase domain-containing protein [Alkalilimnicola ehrlichii MLHE-1]|uniref:Lytic transglycosylase, catalytic n=1 Tax=Alkalilimnicola ehrlichii (strain ATCC BAA-1101 / DSM 17681 / MLHE-1) TaxID=187272 RepID=Q0AA16_ALKEH|nr:lytic transglycosylase domain-containing protein [Alkalilimnicola ehrlichii]ABI56321.1 Lytic transglycosylase, catalytic [Alkalilimnicola ehrlichii MLHE-1]
MHSQLIQNLRVQDLMVSSLLALVVAWLGILMLNNHKPVTHPGTAAADEAAVLQATADLWQHHPWLQPPLENLVRLWMAGRHEVFDNEPDAAQPADPRPLYDQIAEHYPMGAARARQFADWIESAAEAYQVPPELLAAVVAVESSFRVDVRSSVGAVGPAQLRPEYWSELGYNLYEPGENIRAGARVLSSYYHLCDSDWDCALRAYNVGITRVMNGGGSAAGERYVSRISSAPFVAERGGW